MKSIIILLAITLTNFAHATGGKEGGGDDPTVLGGIYRDLNCKPRLPEEGCTFIEISYASDAKGNYEAKGALSGGDILGAYLVNKSPVKLKNDFVYELQIRGERNELSTWIFVRRAQKLINVETGLVLSRSNND